MAEILWSKGNSHQMREVIVAKTFSLMWNLLYMSPCNDKITVFNIFGSSKRQTGAPVK